MRISINSSIANVIRRYRAAAVGMVRMDLGSLSIQWHKPISAFVEPTGNAHEGRYVRLLTSVVSGMSRFKSTNLPLINCQPGRNGQQCLATLSTSSIGTVS